MENSKENSPYSMAEDDSNEEEEESSLQSVDFFDSEEDKTITDTDLSTTAQAFSSRMQRKIREQEKANTQAEELGRIRHQSMLKSLMGIRRSLTDVTRIDLGERFKFMLQADDWNGWARLTIRLQDRVIAGSEYPFFQVTAHDRQARGTIEIQYSQVESPEIMSLIDESEVKRLPTILKKCVRSYLDTVGEIVLNAESEAEEDYSVENSLEQEEKKYAENGIDANLFDDAINDDFIEALPSIDNLEALPDLDDQ